MADYEWTRDEAELVMWKFDECGIEEDSVGYGPIKNDRIYDALAADFLNTQAKLAAYAANQISRHGLEPEGGWAD